MRPEGKRTGFGRRMRGTMNIKITIRALPEDLEAAANAIRAVSENVTYESGVQYTRHGVFVRKNFTVDRLRVKGQGSEENKSLLSAATDSRH